MSAEFTRRVRNGLHRACSAALATEVGGDFTARDHRVIGEALEWLDDMHRDAVVIAFTPRELTLLRAALGNTVHDPAWFDEWVQKRDRKAFASMTEKVWTGYMTGTLGEDGK